MTDSSDPFAWELVITIVGAATALVAAAFSGITLYLTGRRETSQWLRDSVLDALTHFLDASLPARANRSTTRFVHQAPTETPTSSWNNREWRTANRTRR